MVEAESLNDFRTKLDRFVEQRTTGAGGLVKKVPNQWPLEAVRVKVLPYVVLLSTLCAHCWQKDTGRALAQHSLAVLASFPVLTAPPQAVVWTTTTPGVLQHLKGPCKHGASRQPWRRVLLRGWPGYKHSL